MSDRGLPRLAGAPLAGHHPRSTVGHLSLGGSLLASSADDGKVLVWARLRAARPRGVARRWSTGAARTCPLRPARRSHPTADGSPPAGAPTPRRWCCGGPGRARSVPRARS
ncbi:hypothetical protein LT493_32070 [Streptomyces tricolor]|nr:hypothetical protein [Streptomyces tricolor]